MDVSTTANVVAILFAVVSSDVGTSGNVVGTMKTNVDVSDVVDDDGDVLASKTLVTLGAELAEVVDVDVSSTDDAKERLVEVLTDVVSVLVDTV